MDNAMRVAAFPVAGFLVAWALIRLEQALWNCDADGYCEDEEA